MRRSLKEKELDFVRKNDGLEGQQRPLWGGGLCVEDKSSSQAWEEKARA